jgi:hypothetical protein
VAFASAIGAAVAELGDGPRATRRRVAARARIVEHFELGAMRRAYHALWREAWEEVAAAREGR